MSSSTNKNIGKLGEELAAKYLQKKAYRILDRNYRWSRGEIDIVARKNELLIFVEVKTARGDSFGAPENWVDKRKQVQLGQVAERYLQEKQIQDLDCRFDVIGIKVEGENWKIKHIENAFWL